MGFLSTLFAGSASTMVEQVSKVVDEFHLSAEEKQQLNIRMQEILLRREQMLQDSVQAEMSSKERVLVAELTQGDSYTKRARPTVVYAGLVFILLNYTVIPGISLIGGAPRDECTDSGEKDKVEKTCTVNYLTLPEEFWWAWAGIVGTWSIGRTAEKLGSRNTLTSRITGTRFPGRDDGAVG